ncbi:hypothetical protein R5R35_014327 [Gryllus longicercus]|uniref:Uncharacterized protein n=1 Tax=Gryllus longicercus TaxID=2509291 RepID=A0AAN9VD78_9ORTH
MVIMETPKCRKLRRIKESTKKKKQIRTKESRSEECENAITSADATPPHTSKSVIIIERGHDEVRGVEWQYHGKFVESDVPVVWGSPHGSPVVNTVQAVCESPVSRPKRRPTNSVPRKLDAEESEPPQFLNEILALSEKIKAEEKNNVQSSSKTVHEEKESKAQKSVLDESFSNFFDEDMNECMLQCSQELEETSLQKSGPPTSSTLGVNFNRQDTRNINIAEKNPVLRSSPRKKFISNSAKSSLSTSKSSLSTSNSSLSTSSGTFYLQNNINESGTKIPRVGSKNYVHAKPKGNTYVFKGRVLGSRENCSASGSGQGKINRLLDKRVSLDSKPQTSEKLDRISKLSKSCDLSVDNSFETVKESFLDDDLEFLSTIADDVEMVTEMHSREPSKKVPLNSLETKEKANEQQTITSSVLEDSTYFEEGVLQYLDTIESNVTSSQPLRCTPEEIEKKRQEAKLKLQKKKFLSRK